MKSNKYFIILVLTLVISFCLLAVQNVGAVSPPEMVAHWKFDEESGSIMADDTGNGHDGMLSGGKFGNGLYFDGDDDYVSIPDSLSLDSIMDLTIELWVKPSVDYEANPLFYVFTSKYTDSSSFQFVYHKDGYLYLFVSNGIAVQSNPMNLNAETWYHLAATFDSGASNGKIFVDGVDVTDVSSIKTMTQNNLPFCIGVRADTTPDAPNHEVKGTIDEVRLSNNIRYSTGFSLETSPFVTDFNTIGLWHFDESVGTTAFDASGNDNHGTIVNANWAGPTWEIGYFGNALSFDGIDDYVILEDNEFSNLDLDEYTFETWVFIKSLDGVERRIFDDEGGLRPMLSSGNKLEAFHWDSSAWAGKTITWSTTPTILTWYHIVQTYDGSSLKFYINGELLGTVSCNAWEPDGLNREVNIGTWWQGLGRNWKGLIDETRIWNCALSDEEVKRHSWGLVGKWLFDEDPGSTAYDTSGFGNHGILNNMQIDDWVIGRYGTALSFDGEDDYVAIAEKPELEPNEITVETWVKSDSSPGSYKHIISKDLTGHSGWSSYGLYTGASGGLRFYIGHSNPTYVLSPDAGTGVWDGEWHHVAGTYDGAEVSLYVDGVHIGSSSTTETMDFEGVGSLFFGTYDTTWLFFNGEIDEVRIWNKALVPITFDQTGLDCSAGGELVVEVNDPIPLNYEDLPFTMMVPIGTQLTYEYEDPVPSAQTGKGFTLLDITGPSSPVTVDEPTTVPMNMKILFQVHKLVKVSLYWI